MKTFRLSLLLGASILASVSVLPALADDTTSTTPAASSTDPDHTQKVEAFKAALEQLNLADAQKAQIKQIRVKTTDKKERRRQIIAVLTPEQKTKLREMIQAHRNGSES